MGLIGKDGKKYDVAAGLGEKVRFVAWWHLWLNICDNRTLVESGRPISVVKLCWWFYLAVWFRV